MLIYLIYCTFKRNSLILPLVAIMLKVLKFFGLEINAFLGDVLLNLLVFYCLPNFGILMISITFFHGYISSVYNFTIDNNPSSRIIVYVGLHVVIAPRWLWYFEDSNCILQSFSLALAVEYEIRSNSFSFNSYIYYLFLFLMVEVWRVQRAEFKFSYTWFK